MARRKKKRKTSIHDGLVSELEKKLREDGTERIFTFWEYSRRGFVGEIDVLVRDEGESIFYEVKSNYNKKAHSRAQEQYSRFRKAFPKIKSRGYLYCGKELIRLQDG